MIFNQPKKRITDHPPVDANNRLLQQQMNMMSRGQPPPRKRSLVASAQDEEEVVHQSTNNSDIGNLVNRVKTGTFNTRAQQPQPQLYPQNQTFPQLTPNYLSNPSNPVAMVVRGASENVVVGNSANTPVQDMREVYYLTSDRRNRYKDQSASSFSIDIVQNTRTKQRLQAVTLSSVTFPFTAYTITSRNNMLYLSETGNVGTNKAPTFYYQTIPVGTYTITQLVDTLNAISADWTPLTTASVPNPSFGSYTFTTTGTNNEYAWSYDQTTLRVMLKATTYGRAYQLHCQPHRHSLSIQNNTIRPLSTDIRVSGASLVGTDVLRINTSGTKHNIVYNAVIRSLELTSRSNSGRSLTFRNISFFEPTFTNGSINSYGEEYIIIEVTGASASWGGVFDATDTSIDGTLRMVSSENSLWRSLGFIVSTDLGYTKLPLTGVSNGNTLSRTKHKFVTTVPVDFTTADSVFFSTAFQTLAPTYNPAVGLAIFEDTANSSTFAIDKTLITFSNVQIVSNLYAYLPGFYVGNQVVDLRGQGLQIFMKLKINGSSLGQYTMVSNKQNYTDQQDLSSEPIFAHWFVDTAFGATVARFHKQHEMGTFYYKLPTTLSNQISQVADTQTSGGYQQPMNNLEFQLIDETGTLVDLNGLDWQCVLTLDYNGASST